MLRGFHVGCDRHIYIYTPLKLSTVPDLHGAYRFHGAPPCGVVEGFFGHGVGWILRQGL